MREKIISMSVASVVKDSIKFNGQVYTPNRQLAYVTAALCHAFPVTNSKKRSITAATLANSAQSSQNQLVDVEHALEFYGAKNDRICGSIAAWKFPSKKKAIELASSGEKVPMEILVAVYKKAADAEAILEEMATEKNPWRTSLEVEWATNDTAIFDGTKIIPWSECSAEMKACVKPGTVEKFEGRDLTLMMGGEDGEVLFSGAAFTMYPADKDADVMQVAASDKKIIRGWDSADDWRMFQSVASEKVAHTKSSCVIGQTMAALDGHCHDIMSDLTVMPANGHSHYFKPLKFENGILEGITSSMYDYSSTDGTYKEHAHEVSIGGTSKTEAATFAELTGLEAPDMSKKFLQVVREAANSLKASSPDAAKQLSQLADEAEKEVATESIETVIAQRIAAGELFEKKTHLEVIANAEKTVRASIEKEFADKETAAKLVVSTLASRIEKITAAKIDPKTSVGKNRTIESIVAAIPVGTEGDAHFENRLEEWVTLKPAVTGSVASASTTGKIPPLAGAQGSVQKVENKHILI